MIFKKKCNHRYSIVRTSNVLQLDEMGYPLMLCICTCELCGKQTQQWIDVAEEVLKNKDMVILEWN